jgi:endonuclease/exonuclease/phosphatase family metal-dependent hydrolase
MLLGDKNALPTSLQAEGLAVLSRYPILDSKIYLLPRNLRDQRDDHQRGLLSVAVSLPFMFESNSTSLVVEVFNTHLGLSPRAREESVRFIRRIMLDRRNHFCRDDEETGKESWNCQNYLQIFGGDLNAEPQESAIAMIKQKSPQPVVVVNDSGRQRKSTKLLDIWDLMNPGDNGFTFPTNNASKRIDYLFCNEDQAHLVKGVRLIGQIPTPDTAHLINHREGLGMLDLDSPIFASDHLGLIADFWWR